ncbi:site-specific DNA methylase [Anaerolinea thermolimosa]|uniref:DNA adenine methylase n=1 Tax=Anaerolinea thermolimosa TaxID=229919 RepID=UPI0007840944|nr:DNA adenine methylase [Anaerolinea thermolimosa]GAP06126.1 site-specific DNA methylase [Anaerolinea thermolimosa]
MEHLQLHQAIGFVTPLRFPGGKRKVFPFFRDLIEHNNLVGAHYIEPFAGGAGLALSLLVSGYVKEIHLNDLDVAIYALWKTVLEEPEELCERIKAVTLDITTWKQQREVIEHPEQHSKIDVALAALFLNRTNRSGILRGGIIGGLGQSGKWRMDARFNKEGIIKRIRLIADYKDNIRIYNQDAIQFLEVLHQNIFSTEKCLVYADPPYYVKGRTLYYNYYNAEDHHRLAQAMQNLICPWVVSYDDVDDVYALYRGVSHLRYRLHYTAQTRKRGGEVMFFHGLEIPAIDQSRKRWQPMYISESSVFIQA